MDAAIDSQLAAHVVGRATLDAFTRRDLLRYGAAVPVEVLRKHHQLGTVPVDRKPRHTVCIGAVACLVWHGIHLNERNFHACSEGCVEWFCQAWDGSAASQKLAAA